MRIKDFLMEEDGVGVVEVILILVGILTPYYGGSINETGESYHIFQYDPFEFI